MAGVSVNMLHCRSLVREAHPTMRSAGFQISQDARALLCDLGGKSQFNIGFDIRNVSVSFNLDVDMFYQKTTDLLFKKPVNASTGYTTLQSNIGSLENKDLNWH